jgi:hypothetical protein
VKINTREKRVLFTGIVIAAAVLIFYTLTSFLPDRQDLALKIDSKKKAILRQRETLKREESYQKSIEQYNKRLEQDMTLLLPGENSSVAGAELMKLLKDFADQNGVNLTTRNNLPEKKIPGMQLAKVSARVETSCDLDQLVRFLAAIENYPRFLKIEELMINSFRMQAQKKYEIRPGLTVAGYIRLREEKQAEKPASPAGAVVR